MKALFIAVSFFLPILIAVAQTVDVKDVDSAGAEDTTIEIRKGKAGEKKNNAEWELAEGTSDVQGEGAAMNREAKKNWKKACDDWKVEFRNDNKENKIISVSCGTPTCSTESGTVTCSSTATYKVKSRLN
ncbi:MAG: hypothetical protein IPJ71_03930 [Bdellovibrionales bacterium]|nr:hypothetical protein [Bdellovibrionales bacterium]